MLDDNRFGFKIGDLDLIITVIQKYPQIEQAIVFGSRAKGNYKTGSDVDIALKGDIDWEIVSNLNNDLNEETTLPYMFDVLDYNSIDNIALREHIDRIGVVFYEREKALKQGWEIKKLGDMCEVIAGQSPAGKFYNTEGNGLPFYQGKKEFTGKYIGKPTTWTTKITKEAQINDILMSVRAPVGPINFATQKICIGRGLASIRAGRLIDKDFLFYFLLKHETEIVGNTGAVFNSINKNQIEQIKIPIPPITEQQKIVAVLDKAFLAIDQAKQHIEQNLKNAKEIFNSYLNKIFENKHKDWEVKKLGDVCEVIAGQSPAGKFYNTEGNGLPFYQGKKEFTGKYIGKPTTWTTKITKEAQINDILMSVRAPVGPINFATQNICIGRGLASIRAGRLIDKDFLFYFLLKHETEIVGNTGAVFNSINKNQIEQIKIPIPPITEQQAIVIKLDALSVETKQLETIYQQKLTKLEELKKSILQKAFNGELN